MKGKKMAKKIKLLTSAEFASKAGIPASTVSKLIRDGKIKAVKKSGKWMIKPSQLKAKAVTKASKKSKPSPKKKSAKPKKKKIDTQVEKAAKAEKKKPAAAKKAPTKAKEPPPPKAEKPAAAPKTYTIAEFAEMTYLTDKGVADWLKTGLLTGQQDNKGDWQIDAANLEVPNVRRLVRE